MDARGQIAFLFKGGRRARLESAEPGPREFFYGFTELSGADLIEEDDLGVVTSSFWTNRPMEGFVARLTGLNTGSIARFSHPDALSRLNGYDAVVATTNSQGLALAFLRARGLLKTRVLFIPMGVLEPESLPWRRGLYKRLLRHLSLAPLSRSEAVFLKKCLGPGGDVEYLPFGVDLRFWAPANGNEGGGDYVLSIGNDWKRDYATLAAAWRPEYPLLKVVTNLPVPLSPGNVESIIGDWRKRLLSDEEVRSLFQNARFVVLPVRQTIQPSAQSACLQAMACGKAVVISDIKGLWDREVLVGGKACQLAPPGSVEGLRAAIEELLESPQRVNEMGRRGRQAVENHFNLDIMVNALKKRLEQRP